MALSSNAVKRLCIATTDKTVGNEIASAINMGLAGIAQGSLTVAAVITGVAGGSTTVGMGALLTGDIVLQIPAASGNLQFLTVVADATLPEAQVNTDKYVVLRAITAVGTAASGTLSDDAKRRLLYALTSQTIADEVVSAINDGQAVSAQCAYMIADVIQCQNGAGSLSADFGSLEVGDLVLQFGDTAGGGKFHAILIAGALPAAAVSSVQYDQYVVLRPFAIPTPTSVVF